MLELLAGYAQHGAAHGSQARPLGSPALGGGQGRGWRDVGRGAWRQGCPT